MFERIKAWWRRRSEGDQGSSYDARVDTFTAARSDSAEHGSLPPNYLPTGVDEGRPKK
jgi:hypothetical protein